MSMNLVVLLYLAASVCFIQALKGLSHPTTSIRGNAFGMAGMTIAVLTTAALIASPTRSRRRSRLLHSCRRRSKNDPRRTATESQGAGCVCSALSG